ncbi:Y-family DNA polymerase [Photobacterium lutimaris]|uniref:DNA polymerase V UmuC n=1 Tax=Photobacterium lutimaris TaxID=388278 RepID=A0A2T3J4E6_9GAMM|nr:Y-family DNA polymerase [Photobacterium lutimaris]PSU36136.1 DNA polymerase V UmuC [Photobacterium lutimaris]TDR79243.1 DNA polymerase V [Photobacterium lutimaris]
MAALDGYRDQVWALVDAKSFYCACEQIFDPKLVNKPLVVLSNNDGCCVALSPQAKALGIKRGAPWFKIEREARKMGVEVRSSNYTLYADMSRRFIEELHHFSPHVEQYSIDEAFIRLDGFKLDGLTQKGQDIRDTVYSHLGLPVRVGIGASPTLAKLANHAAKQFEQRVEGVIQIDNEERRRWLLERCTVQEIWGIGAKTATRLHTSGITNALELSEQSPADMRRLWNVGLARTVLELQGVACIEPGDIDEKRKQILSSRSFGTDLTDLSDLKAALAFHCQRAGEKLRRQQSQASVVSVFLRTNRYKDLPQHNISCAKELMCPSQDSYRFLDTAIALLKSVYRPGYAYQKIGVILEGLTDANNDQFQFDMFDSSALEEVKRRDLMAITDQMNAKFKNGVKPASVIGSTNWHMRQAFRSNRWTTRLDELQVAKC